MRARRFNRADFRAPFQGDFGAIPKEQQLTYKGQRFRVKSRVKFREFGIQKTVKNTRNFILVLQLIRAKFDFKQVACCKISKSIYGIYFDFLNIFFG